MEYIVLDLNTATEEQLKAANGCNSRTARLMSSEISKLRRVAEVTKKAGQSSKEEPIEKTAVEEPKVTEIDEDFENEVEYYYSALKELKLEELEEKISAALPSRQNYQYKRILYRIKAEEMRNIKEIKDIIAEEGMSLEEVIEFKDELILIQERLRLIDSQLSKEQEQEECITTKKKNNLIFVPTPGGNIRVLDEIEHMPPEYYDRFYGLFQSIKNGTFKNVRRFVRNSEQAGLCEVKDFQVRVLFVRLNEASYAVISAFIKKTDKDLAHRGSTIKKYTDYQAVEKKLVENLDNEEFMKLNQQYEEELFEKLSPKEKASGTLKKKRGEA